MTRLLALSCILSLCAASFAATRPAPPPLAVSQERDGKLTYATSGRGDRIVDFSNCGYMGADEPIPSVSIRVVVTPKVAASRPARAWRSCARKLPPSYTRWTNCRLAVQVLSWPNGRSVSPPPPNGFPGGHCRKRSISATRSSI